MLVVKVSDGYTLLLWKYLEEGLLGKHKSKREDNIKNYLEGILWYYSDIIYLTQHNEAYSDRLNK
jgi:hypothetical protein